LRRICRKKRTEAAQRHLTAIRKLCIEAGIEMRETEHGHQFLLREYVINWSPSTNRVQVQYRMSGHGRTVPFTRAGADGKPRIVIALEEMAGLVAGAPNQSCDSVV
jgi:hypothetical protein